MIGFFQKKLLGSALKRIGKGIIKEIPIVGQIQDNIKSDDGGRGKFDWYKLIGSLIPIILLIAFLAGWISMDQIKELLKLLK